MGVVEKLPLTCRPYRDEGKRGMHRGLRLEHAVPQGGKSKVPVFIDAPEKSALKPRLMTGSQFGDW